ncbi:hypothetical protein [Grimontia sp. NTOU-MAR1]|uniref:hypothetical protein n=1 Tax=Grimontia sp. NTOU-MAR1 TaxID=3111011 RepID=UPI002DB8D440|nr:hypothetical protein [Grimontia sp. NTOU-MAR1]WRW00273.1 hypothetical protein VP504_25175 [Grimontia sp. NTOU-MAR1]
MPIGLRARRRFYLQCRTLFRGPDWCELVESAVNGLGVALCPKVLALNELKKHRLVSPMGFAKDGSYYGLLHDSSKPLSHEATEVKSWLKSLGESLSEESKN